MQSALVSSPMVKVTLIVYLVINFSMSFIPILLCYLIHLEKCILILVYFKFWEEYPIPPHSLWYYYYLGFPLLILILDFYLCPYYLSPSYLVLLVFLELGICRIINEKFISQIVKIVQLYILYYSIFYLLYLLPFHFFIIFGILKY